VTQFGIIRNAALYSGHAPATIEQFRSIWQSKGFPPLDAPRPSHGQPSLFPHDIRRARTNAEVLATVPATFKEPMECLAVPTLPTGPIGCSRSSSMDTVSSP
jgi:hypothetical protein